ncbi:hypothetical protein K8R66_03580 [bacterium]|nr:hypothetical protein [bacterium]
MKYYQVKNQPLSGTNYQEIRKKSLNHYHKIKSKSKRKPYIRSAYFKKNKIFLDIFWSHLYERKNFIDLMRRMKLYPCALELIDDSTLEPISKKNPNKSSEILHRFGGITPQKEIFFVQIKENKRSGSKWLISVFPIDKKQKKTFR